MLRGALLKTPAITPGCVCIMSMGVRPHDPVVSNTCLTRWKTQSSMADMVRRPCSAPYREEKRIPNLTERIDAGWRAVTPHNPPKWTMPMRPQTTGGGNNVLKAQADRPLEWNWDAVKNRPPKWSCTRRGETLAPPGGAPMPTPGVGEYAWRIDNVLVRAPQWTMAMPNRSGETRGSTPGPGSYVARNDAFLKTSPSWTALGRDETRFESGIGPGVGAYDIATKSGMPHWTMLGRRGDPKDKKKTPGPGAYNFKHTTNLVHPVLEMPPRMTFPKSQRF